MFLCFQLGDWNLVTVVDHFAVKYNFYKKLELSKVLKTVGKQSENQDETPESNQCHAAIPTCSENLEVSTVSSLRSHSRCISLSQDSNDRYLSHGLGHDLRRPSNSRSLDRPSSRVAYKSPRYVSHIPSIPSIAFFLAHYVLVMTDNTRQYV